MMLLKSKSIADQLTRAKGCNTTGKMRGENGLSSPMGSFFSHYFLTNALSFSYFISSKRIALFGLTDSLDFI